MSKTLYIFLVFGFFVHLSAEPNIDAQIQKIRNAPPAQRVEMMNALKVQLSTMNASQRGEAISRLRAHSHTQHNSKNQEQEHNHHRDMRQNSNQSDNIQYMHRNERMNQIQGGDQYIEEKGGMDNYKNNMDTQNHNTQPSFMDTKEPYSQPTNNTNSDNPMDTQVDSTGTNKVDKYNR